MSVIDINIQAEWRKESGVAMCIICCDKIYGEHYRLRLHVNGCCASDTTGTENTVCVSCYNIMKTQIG